MFYNYLVLPDHITVLLPTIIMLEQRNLHERKESVFVRPEGEVIVPKKLNTLKQILW